MPTPELLHCPFCEGTPNLIEPEKSINGQYAVTCALCGATVGPEPKALGKGNTPRQIVISKWNHRMPAPQAPAATRPALQVGVDYTHDEITALFNPTPQFIQFVLAHGDRIVALRVREDCNPHITGPKPQVWVGATGEQTKWGRILAETTHPVQVFIQRQGRRKFTCHGPYKVTRSTTAPAKLAEALERVPHNYGLSRIVYLEEC
jgi:hypothetical protein